MIKSRGGGLLVVVFIPYSLQPLGAQYSTNIQIGGGVLSCRVSCGPVCMYIVKTWPESTSQGACRRGWAANVQAGLRPRSGSVTPNRAAQPRVRTTGGAPCPFKEADRTTTTFLTGEGRYSEKLVLLEVNQKTISFLLSRWPEF